MGNTIFADPFGNLLTGVRQRRQDDLQEAQLAEQIARERARRQDAALERALRVELAQNEQQFQLARDQLQAEQAQQQRLLQQQFTAGESALDRNQRARLAVLEQAAATERAQLTQSGLNQRQAAEIGAAAELQAERLTSAAALQDRRIAAETTNLIRQAEQRLALARTEFEYNSALQELRGAQAQALAQINNTARASLAESSDARNFAAQRALAETNNAAALERTRAAGQLDIEAVEARNQGTNFANFALGNQAPPPFTATTSPPPLQSTPATPPSPQSPTVGGQTLVERLQAVSPDQARSAFRSGGPGLPSTAENVEAVRRALNGQGGIVRGAQRTRMREWLARAEAGG